MKYIEKVMNIMEETASSMEQINTQLEELDSQRKSKTLSETEYRTQAAELEDQKDFVVQGAVQECQTVCESYSETVKKNSILDSTMIHEDAKLLQLDGLDMTEWQFTALLDKHADNPLMILLLQAYSRKHPGLYDSPLPTAEVKIRAFKDYVAAACNAIQTPAFLGSTLALFRCGENVPAFCTESE